MMADRPVMIYAPMDGIERSAEETRRMSHRQGAIARAAIDDATGARARLHRALVKGWMMAVGVN